MAVEVKVPGWGSRSRGMINPGINQPVNGSTEMRFYWNLRRIRRPLRLYLRPPEFLKFW